MAVDVKIRFEPQHLRSGNPWPSAFSNPKSLCHVNDCKTFSHNLSVASELACVSASSGLRPQCLWKGITGRLYCIPPFFPLILLMFTGLHNTMATFSNITEEPMILSNLSFSEFIGTKFCLQNRTYCWDRSQAAMDRLCVGCFHHLKFWKKASIIGLESGTLLSKDCSEKLLANSPRRKPNCSVKQNGPNSSDLSMTNTQPTILPWRTLKKYSWFVNASPSLRTGTGCAWQKFKSRNIELCNKHNKRVGRAMWDQSFYFLFHESFHLTPLM